jgi:hypothetical protein
MREVTIKGHEYRLPEVTGFLAAESRPVYEGCDIFSCYCDGVDCDDCLLGKSNEAALISYINRGETHE